MACCDDLSGLAIDLIIQDSNHLSKRNKLLPKSYRHTFAGDAASSEVPSLALMNISHLRCGPVGVRFIEPAMTGVINAPQAHKFRPYKDLKRKFPYYQVSKLKVTLLCKLESGNSL